MTDDATSYTVESLRREMDKIDAHLARTLQSRLALSLNIQAFKRLRGLEAYDPSREDEIAARTAMAGFEPEVVEMMAAIVRICRRAGEPSRSGTIPDRAAGPSTSP